ncbi:MAG TPA: poly(R)-hydroxyalkanoic acid synthase subunit PhaE [Steroidobacteraceae bacterium]|nr:poly(R)-hydroxyalkanoic acid synthase subunit PhaE [Steroidobacteraceae bacterium]
MQSPYTSAGFRPDEAFTGAAERFFELLKTFGMTASAKSPDWSAMAAPLAGQFEQWLRLSQSVMPWFGAPWFGATGSGAPGFAMPSPGPLGPLPLGPAAAHGKDAQRTLELLGQLARLQGELGAHWSEIASTAAQRFIARLRTRPTPPASLDEALKLYEVWVSCAEEAYAATVHKEDFARLQSEIANTSAALLAEQRRHVDSMARAFGVPTRSEVDELYAQLKELRRRVDEPGTAAHTSAGTAHGSATPGTGSRARARPASARASKRGKRSSRTARKRPRPRGPRP